MKNKTNYCNECRYYESCQVHFSELPEHGCNAYEKWESKRTRSKKVNKTSTLCWSCARLDCSWMKKLEPVAGWEAIKTDVGHTTPQGYVHLPSYCVLSCPGYVMAENHVKNK